MEILNKQGKLKVEITSIVDDITIGVTTVSGGISGQALYNNAGILGELNLGSVYVPLIRTLTINGTTQDLSANRTFTVSTGITIGTTAITSGTNGRFLFDDGGVVSETNGAFWDKVNGRFGLGTSTPTVALDIVGAGKFSTSLEITSTAGITFGGGATALSYTSSQLNIGNSATWTDVRFFVGGVQKYIQTPTLTTISNTTINLSTTTVQLAGVSALTYSGADIRIGSITAGFTSLSFYTAATEKMRIAPTTGNVLINTTTDAGFKLDVNGTARVSGNVTLNNTSGTNRSTDLRTTNSIDNFATSTFYPSSGTNVGQSFQVIPRGTGFSAGIKAQFAISGTDTIADGTNFEAMVVRATGSAFTISSGKGGTGVVRPMLFSSGFLDGVTNPNQLWLFTTGNIGINTTTDVASSKLTIESTTQGFLPPRMTTTQKNAIATPATGLMVYDTTLNLISVYNGTTWITL